MIPRSSRPSPLLARRLPFAIAVALLLGGASELAAQEPEPRPVPLPPTTTIAEARRAASAHSYWRGTDPETGCPRGLLPDECATLERALVRLERHRDRFCRAAAARTRARIAEGRVIVPAVDGPERGDRVDRGDIVLPANWIAAASLPQLLVAQVSEDGMKAGERCGERQS